MTRTASLNAPAAVAVPHGGLPAAIGAFAIWGLFPLYLRALAVVPALQLVAHRVAWACLFVFGWMAVRGELGELRQVLSRPGVVLRLTATALLITVNWLVFVWAVANGHVVETSLGYFINPLVNVLLGVVLLSERLNRAQWTAVALAAFGVVYLTWTAGRLPWIALALAFSFGIYGFIRKTARVEALPGLAVETALLAPVAIGYLFWAAAQGNGSMGHAGVLIDVMLVASGAITAIPLFLFSYGERRLPYSTVCIIQYLAPTLQLATAVLLFHEPFDRARLTGFACIWIALLIYAGDGMLRARAAARP